MASLLSRDLGADLFEIEPATPYPADYFATVEQAKKERERDYLPPLKAIVRDLATYDAVYLGFPAWGGSAPPVIRSFLAAHDFAGMAVAPFNLHGGYGLGDSLEVITRAAPQARFAEGFVMEGLQERRTTENVRKWLTKVSVDQ
ncbi:flavodoxin [Mesorhizobium sp. M0317]|uniref:flavodoxin n=1 Tax=Mesorhizobium sp. M0317 TaxID=2956935 RepID=UPI003339EFF3